MDRPGRNDGETTACARCGQRFRPLGRRRFCSAARRQAAWRRRHPAPPPPLPTTAPRVRTIYECPECQARLLGEQRCPDCRRFCRRIGPGGPCPHCDESVALADLIATDATEGR